MFTASWESPLLSATISSIFLPFTPPALLISATFNSTPSFTATPYCATSPVRGAITPILITSLSAAAPLPPALLLLPQLNTKKVNAKIINNNFFIFPPKFIS